MAWLSAAASNQDLCAQLLDFRVLLPGPVLEAFQRTDRGDFVLPDDRAAAYLDRPFRRGSLHLSAPHMYGTVLEALDLAPGLSFLNIGSGSGYLTCLAACLTGPGSVSHGIEICAANVAHSRACVDRWIRGAYPGLELTHGIQIVHGNCFAIDINGAARYDRIYVGAGCPDSRKELFFHLLAEGGVLVLPVDDRNELIKVRKLCGRVLSCALVSHVRFAALVDVPPETPGAESDADIVLDPRLALVASAKVGDLLLARPPPPRGFGPGQPVALPSLTWAPMCHVHRQFPRTFRDIVRMLLLAANRVHVSSPQLALRARPLCARLPLAVWFIVLSYASRDWFVLEDPVTQLRAELLVVQKMCRRAEESLRAAELARRTAERERDLYRMAFVRSKARLSEEHNLQDESEELDFSEESDSDSNSDEQLSMAQEDNPYEAGGAEDVGALLSASSDTSGPEYDSATESMEVAEDLPEVPEVSEDQPEPAAGAPPPQQASLFDQMMLRDGHAYRAPPEPSLPPMSAAYPASSQACSLVSETTAEAGSLPSDLAGPLRGDSESPPPSTGAGSLSDDDL